MSSQLFFPPGTGRGCAPKDSASDARRVHVIRRLVCYAPLRGTSRMITGAFPPAERRPASRDERSSNQRQQGAAAAVGGSCDAH